MICIVHGTYPDDITMLYIELRPKDISDDDGPVSFMFSAGQSHGAIPSKLKAPRIACTTSSTMAAAMRPRDTDVEDGLGIGMKLPNAIEIVTSNSAQWVPMAANVNGEVHVFCLVRPASLLPVRAKTKSPT